MIMTHLSMWAHKNGWIVINVPSCHKWTHKKKKINRMFNGLYVQN